MIGDPSDPAASYRDLLVVHETWKLGDRAGP